MYVYEFYSLLVKFIIGKKAKSDVSLDSELNKRDLLDVKYMIGGKSSRKATDDQLANSQTDRIEQLMSSVCYREIDQNLNEDTMKAHMAAFSDILNDY